MGPNVPAAFGVIDCRAKQLRPRQLAEITVCFAEGLERRRHADRLVSDIVHVAFENKSVSVTGFALDQVLPHVGPHGGWSRCVEIVVGMHHLRWKIRGQASEAGNSAHHRVHNGLHQRRRDRGVDGIAAGGSMSLPASVASGCGVTTMPLRIKLSLLAPRVC